MELTANLWTYRHRPLYANGTLYGGLIATIGLITPDLFALEEHFIEELPPDGLIATPSADGFTMDLSPFRKSLCPYGSYWSRNDFPTDDGYATLRHYHKVATLCK